VRAQAGVLLPARNQATSPARVPRPVLLLARAQAGVLLPARNQATFQARVPRLVLRLRAQAGVLLRGTSEEPSNFPSKSAAPSVAPSESPSRSREGPSNSPSKSAAPSVAPSESPSRSPSPSEEPSNFPQARVQRPVLLLVRAQAGVLLPARDQATFQAKAHFPVWVRAGVPAGAQPLLSRRAAYQVGALLQVSLHLIHATTSSSSLTLSVSRSRTPWVPSCLMVLTCRTSGSVGMV
jgi:hypothetical protein